MLRIDPKTKTYSAEIKHRIFGRVHLSLRTKKEREAMARHAALEQLLNEGEPVADLVEQLRKRRLTIEAVAACVREKLPFPSLRRRDAWPALGAAVEQYLDHLDARADGSKATRMNSVSALAAPLGFIGRDHQLDGITGEHIEALRHFMLAKRIDAGQDVEALGAIAATAWATNPDGWRATLGVTVSGVGLSSNTVSLYLTKLSAIFSYHRDREARRARQQHRAPRPLYSPIDRGEHVPAIVKTRVRFLDEAEALRLQTAAPPVWKFAVVGGFLAGLRLNEMLNLRRPPMDVDLEAQMLYVQRRDGWKPKSRKDREVPIAAQLLPIAVHHLKTFAGEVYLYPGKTDPTVPLDDRYFSSVFQTIVEDAGLIVGREHPQGVTYHTLRHTFASWLVMEGVDLFTVAKLMGHANITEVQATYGHLSPHHKRTAVDQLGKRWSAYIVASASIGARAVTGADARSTQVETQKPSLNGGSHG